MPDYFYVHDAVDAYLRLAEALSNEDFYGQAFNFGTEEPVSVREIIDLILRLSGKTWLTPLILDQAKHEIPRQYLDCTKARELLAWRPKYSLERAMQETIEWYQRWLEQGARQMPAPGQDPAEGDAGASHSFGALRSQMSAPLKGQPDRLCPLST